ncbi:TPT-domain-containing protein [Geranomyces variabilis]|nr:TPT-domain-containing protein [Geranomyces variabilis]KAJ3136328.1 Triose-phosphate Transporter [Geranomyces variabilis]
MPPNFHVREDERLSSDSIGSSDSAHLLSAKDLRLALHDDRNNAASTTAEWDSPSADTDRYRTGSTDEPFRWRTLPSRLRRVYAGVLRSPTSPDEASFAREWWRKAAKASFFIASWYTFSLSLSFYNTWLFHEGKHNFPFPLFTTMIHTVIQFLLSGVCVLFIWPSMRPKRHPALRDYFTKVFPCGIATGMDIGLSNSSLKVITLSFYTMVKSAAPVFVLLFAFLFGLERPTWSLTSIIAIICFGVLLMVMNEAEFNLVGYIEVQTATVLSGLRWALTQMLLERESMGMNNPLAATVFLAPLMALSLLIACSALEGLPTVFRSEFFDTFGESMRIIAIMCAGGVLAFFMVVSEFMLISQTSIVTFSVAGIFKEIITLVGARHVYGDAFPPNKIAGLIISLGGIAGYNYVRINQMRKTHHRTAQHRGVASEQDDSGEEGAYEGSRAARRGLLYGFHPVNAIGGADVDNSSDIDLRGYEDVDLSDDNLPL